MLCVNSTSTMLSAAEVADAFEELQGLLVDSELTAFRTLTATLFDGNAL